MSRRDSVLVSRTIYQISVVTMVAAVVWVLIGIYIASTKATNINVDKALLEPINPSLDQATFNEMLKRENVTIEVSEVDSEDEPTN